MMDANNNDHVFKATANWTLAGGSVTDSISFDDGSISTAVDHVAKSPLLLLPPIHEDEPCEITITFAQEHELRQIYIRSSARVYEVYYTKNRRDDREYLCTVRCGIAIREEEEVLQIPLTELASPKNGVAPVKDNGNGRTNEDDWVEVKSTDTSLLNNGKDQLGKQEFFEATAEINDAEPCISVTLRLLSLQDKRGALIDEVYVFADPVDQSDSEKEEAIGTGNSSSSALMAMFMPTLMQLSRGNNVRKEQDIQLPEKFNSRNPETLRNSNGSDKMQQETNFSKADHIGVSSPVLVDNLAKRVDSATRVSEAEMKPGMSCNNMETILHQLVNKVSSIETILTRFEDQMLKPINSIDARLQLVERKVEELVKKSYESELLFETKVSNTDCLSSDTVKTPDTDELDRETNNTNDPKMEPCTSIDVPELSSTISEQCDVVLSKNGLEKFVELGSEEKSISAESEISKDEVGHSFERRSLEEKPKRSVSINDALASALAGLLSSTSIMDRKYSKALVVTAPEFPNEDSMEIEEKPNVSTYPDKAEELGNTYTALDTPTSPQKELGITLHTKDDSNGVSESLNDGNDAETVVSVRNDDLDEQTVTSRTEPDCHEPGNPETELENSNVTMDCGVDDVLKSVLGFEQTNSSIDFLTPVLDVEFKSEKKVSDNNCFFETLLTTKSKTVVDCKNEEAFDDRLVSVEDEELIGPPTDTLSSLEMDHYETNEMHLQFNGELSTASLI